MLWSACEDLLLLLVLTEGWVTSPQVVSLSGK